MLEDNKFLFVDDDVQSIFYFRKGLVKKGAKPENVMSVDTLKEAIDKIRILNFDFIFIDLYCAPSCPELKMYEAKLGNIEFNQGQLLGLWLDDNYPLIRYAYVTQIPGLANPINPMQESKPVFNKNKLTSLDFSNKVIDLLSSSTYTITQTEYLLDEKQEERKFSSHVSSKIRYDFALVTALSEELDALLKKLPNYKKLSPIEEDIRTYFEADIPVKFPNGSSGSYKVIVMCLMGMGRLQAAMATADAIQSWNPRYVILIGIAGGMKTRGVKIGDILISDQIVDYEQQKITAEGSEIRWDVQRADARLLNAANNFMGDSWQEAITIKRPAAGKPKIHIGPIASGDKVIAFGDVLQRYKTIWPKIIGVEMEAGGAATASFQSPEKPGFFMVRGVSDLADEKKNTEIVEKWRSYACDVAASFSISLLQSGPVPLATD